MAFEALAHRATARQATRLEHRPFEIAAPLSIKSGSVTRHQVELVGVALQGAHELHGVAALGEHAIEGTVEGDKLAVEGGSDHVVDADRRSVTQHRQSIVERDRLAA